MGAKRIIADAMPSPGIYLVRCRATGDSYVGLASSISARLADHRRKLITSRHPIAQMNTLAFAHGIESFEFSALEYCDVVDLDDREWHWLLATRPTLNPKVPDYDVSANGTRRWSQPWICYSDERRRSINHKRQRTKALRRYKKS